MTRQTPKPESADLCNWILHYVYKNEMKTILIITATIICGLLEGNDHNATKSKNSKIVVRPTPSTLDSIQGAWTNISDLHDNMTIVGRNLDQYNTSPVLNVHEYYRIYFSDTLVMPDNLLSDVSIDTTATSGQYLIKVLNGSGDVFCFHINGFATEPNTTLLDWSLEATFGHRQATVYRQH